MASTMMACPEGMDTEKAFLNALTRVKTWKITEQQLELFDATDEIVARLEARRPVAR
jgi:heat shock protein HslJ